MRGNTDEIEISVARRSQVPLTFRPTLYARKILKVLGITQGKFEFTFVDNATLTEMNRAYLEHDYDTDIITFSLGDGDELMGDLYISVEQAQIQARDQGQSLENELKTLMIHGILHLLGYDDQTDAQRKIMFERQSAILELAR